MAIETSRRQSTASTAALYLAIELPQREWKLAFTSGLAAKARLRSPPAGDLFRLGQELARAREARALPSRCRVLSCYEAGRDGFWVHRLLHEADIHNVVVDSSSIAVDRRRRRAKTERLDAVAGVDLLVRHDLGGRRVFSVVHAPSPEQEDARQLHRELAAAKHDQTRLSTRIRGLLAGQGVRVAGALHADLAVDALRTWDGQPLLPGLRRRLAVELAHLGTIHRRILDREAERRRALAQASSPALALVAAAAAPARHRSQRRRALRPRALRLARAAQSPPGRRSGRSHAHALRDWRHRP